MSECYAIRCPKNWDRTTQEFIRPYTPEQNRLIERFFQSLKEECIWQHRFQSLAHARHVLGQWIRFYNKEQPHQSLGYAAPSAHPALASEGAQKTGGHYKIIEGSCNIEFMDS